MSDGAYTCPFGFPAQTLLEYQDGLLDAQQRVRVQKHIEECPHCAGELERLRGIQSMLLSDPTVFHPGMDELHGFAKDGADPGGFIGEHLLACSECRDMVDLLREIAERPESMPSAELSMPDGLKHRIEAIIPRGRPVTPSRSLGSRIREWFFPVERLPVLAMGTAAALVLVAVVVLPVWRDMEEEAYETRPVEQLEKKPSGLRYKDRERKRGMGQGAPSRDRAPLGIDEPIKGKEAPVPDGGQPKPEPPPAPAMDSFEMAPRPTAEKPRAPQRIMAEIDQAPATRRVPERSIYGEAPRPGLPAGRHRAPETPEATRSGKRFQWSQVPRRSQARAVVTLDVREPDGNALEALQSRILTMHKDEPSALGAARPDKLHEEEGAPLDLKEEARSLAEYRIEMVVSQRGETYEVFARLLNVGSGTEECAVKEEAIPKERLVRELRRIVDSLVESVHGLLVPPRR